MFNFAEVSGYAVNDNEGKQGMENIKYGIWKMCSQLEWCTPTDSNCQPCEVPLQREFLSIGLFDGHVREVQLSP